MKGLIRKILKEELLTETSMPTSDKIIEIINNTISKGGSKTYKDLFNVKGEAAVGILHWTTRGLDKLYKEMDTERYFNKSEDDMMWTSNPKYYLYDGLHLTNDGHRMLAKAMLPIMFKVGKE